MLLSGANNEFGGSNTIGGTTAGAMTCGDGLIVALEPIQGRVVWSRTFDGTFTARDCRPQCPYHGRCPPVDDDELTAMALDSHGHVLMGLALFDRVGAGIRPQASVRRLSVPAPTHP